MNLGVYDMRFIGVKNLIKKCRLKGEVKFKNNWR